jgi:hypothetical protein
MYQLGELGRVRSSGRAILLKVSKWRDSLLKEKKGLS